jgi:NAD(P)-dependent dehydrogenase (short-subunit alcohol dehydrogenase family)
MEAAGRVLKGRHAIVTGGGRGIGAAIADGLAAQGARLTIMGRDVAVLEQCATRLRERHGATVQPVRCDVMDEQSVRHAFADAATASGDAHILVNNAGQAAGAPFLETTTELWNTLIAANLTGAFFCSREVVTAMLAAGDGRIINIASTSGLKGYRNVAAYCAAKHGLVGLTRALAAETARSGITVNAVCPAYTDTAMAERAITNIARDFDKTPEEARAAIARSIPRGTLIQPLEVASMVVWLCSPEAAAVSGQALVVAGGEI